MRRVLNTAIGIVIAVSTLLTLSTDALANPIAGGGYSSSYAGESIFTNIGAGGSGQFSAIFFNDGTQTWLPGVVGLLVCAADKVTCNVPSNSNFNHGWLSPTVYATVTAAVGPGQNGFFIYNFDVPTNTAPGTVTNFNGDVGLIANGNEFRPEGYFQVNTVPVPQLTVSPSPAQVRVGTTQQFTVSGQAAGTPVTWAVNGGCGAITSAGLFAATSMNSATQPCTVVATAAGATGIAAVVVFGQPTQLSCVATPTSIVANGGLTGGVSIAKISLKDANGNVVADASLPTVNVNNVTPTLATMIPTGSVSPINGVVSISISSTTTPGDIQLSASASGLTGCNAIVTSTGAGLAAKTIATFVTNPIAADATSTSTLQVDVTDSAGNRVNGDNATQIEVSRTSGAGVCNIISPIIQGSGGSIGPGSAVATVANGRVAFGVQSTTTPGTCVFSATTNNPAISGTSASLTTQIVGVANRVSVLTNDSPHSVSNSGTCSTAGNNTDLSCTTIVVGVLDGNGALITGDSGRTITATLDTVSCNGAGGGTPVLRQSTLTSAGKATFLFSSAGAYGGCTITFSSGGIASANTSAAWTAGSANHLGCIFSPTPIPPDNTAQSAGLVTVRDQFNNSLTTGTYQVNFARSTGSATTLLSSSPQTMNGGSVVFVVRSNSTVGSDTYVPSLAVGSLAGANTDCTIVVQ
jgi:hypothetical protein